MTALAFILCACIIGITGWCISQLLRGFRIAPLLFGACAVSLAVAGYIVCYFLLHAMIGSAS